MIYLGKMREIKLLILLGAILLGACLPEQGSSTFIASTITPAPSKLPQPTNTIIPITPTPPIQITRDIIYAEPLQNQVSEQGLDIYAPLEAGPWPVVVFLHGSGRKESQIEFSQMLAESGVVVFTIDWPTWNASRAAQEDGKGFREMYEVMSCAIRFAKATAADHGGDPSKVILVGFSGGARYGSWFALSDDNLDPMWDEFSALRGGPHPQVSCVVDGFSADVIAFVGIGGHYSYIENLKDSDIELYTIVSPLAQIGKRPDLTVRVLHGEKDQNYPTSFSARLNDLLDAAGYDTALILFDGAHQVPVDLTIRIVTELARTE